MINKLQREEDTRSFIVDWREDQPLPVLAQLLTNRWYKWQSDASILSHTEHYQIIGVELRTHWDNYCRQRWSNGLCKLITYTIKFIPLQRGSWSALLLVVLISNFDRIFGNCQACSKMQFEISKDIWPIRNNIPFARNDSISHMNSL
jgi:hypothetical protein